MSSVPTALELHNAALAKETQKEKKKATAKSKLVIEATRKAPSAVHQLLKTAKQVMYKESKVRSERHSLEMCQEMQKILIAGGYNASVQSKFEYDERTPTKHRVLLHFK